MKHHFYNLNWFMKMWPGEYFFEQAFMNHYFCINCLTDNDIFDKKIRLVSSFDAPNEGEILLHFIGPALNGKAKVNYIEKYLKSNNL